MVTLLCCLALTAPGVSYAKDAIYTGIFSNKAVSGYDVVAYFTNGEARQGRRAFKPTYQQADWYFDTAENLQLFLANPTKYAPQYGGYCAWAVAQGETASSDPTQWRIVDGKLYLNYNAKVAKQWAADIPNNIAAADEHWPRVLD